MWSLALAKSITPCYGFAMGKLLTADEAAARHFVTGGRIRELCRARRIKGARCIAGRWFVPEDFTIEPGKRGPAIGSTTKRSK